MLKDVPGWKLSEGCPGKVSVASISGATTKCMQHHIKAFIGKSPDCIIVHAGTNDLVLDKTPEKIADDVVSLAIIVSSANITPVISGLVPRGDRCRQKAFKVNSILQRQCADRNIAFVDNSNINANAHLNRSRLHLNAKGAKLLTKNFSRYINKR